MNYWNLYDMAVRQQAQRRYFKLRVARPPESGLELTCLEFD